MALTRHYKATVVDRVQREPAFARALIEEAGSMLLNGEADAARLVLRDLVHGTLGFEALAKMTAINNKSLHRMLSRSGNPTMGNVAAIFSTLRAALKVEMQVHALLA